MEANLKEIHPVLMSNDVSASIDFYRHLGFTLMFQDEPTDPKYGVMRRDGVELHIQWQDQNQWGYPIDRPAYRFFVEDVDAIYREFTMNGVVSTESNGGGPWARPAETPWGTREFHLRDPGQNSLQFYHPL